MGRESRFFFIIMYYVPGYTEKGIGNLNNKDLGADSLKQEKPAAATTAKARGRGEDVTKRVN